MATIAKEYNLVIVTRVDNLYSVPIDEWRARAQAFTDMGGYNVPGGELGAPKGPKSRFVTNGPDFGKLNLLSLCMMGDSPESCVTDTIHIMPGEGAVRVYGRSGCDTCTDIPKRGGHANDSHNPINLRE